MREDLFENDSRFSETGGIEDYRESLELYSGDSDFKNTMESFRCTSDEHVFRRYCSWLRFLNARRLTCPFYYNDLLIVITESFSSKSKIRRQTRNDFEISLQFVGYLFSENPFGEFGSPAAARLFLRMAIWHAEYHGLLVSSIKTAMSETGQKVDLTQLKRLFKKIYIRYENPAILTNHLHLLNEDEVDLLMHVVSGRNIREHSYMPLQLSKKESYAFVFQLPGSLKFETELLARACVCAKLAAVHKDSPRFIRQFHDCFHQEFEYDMEIHNHIDFWKTGFKFIIEAMGKPDCLPMQSYVDYFTDQLWLNPAYSLSGRNFTSINRQVLHWEANGANHSSKSTEPDLKWPGRDLGVFEFEHIGNHYRILELCSTEELREESGELKHCVFSYARRCFAGRINIFSMQQKSEDWERRLTIEIRGNQLFQIAGYMNREPDEQELVVLKRWMHQAGFYAGVAGWKTTPEYQ